MMMMMMMMMMIMNRKSKKTTQKSNFEMILKILVYHRFVQVVLPLAKQCLGLCDRDGFRWVLEILSPWKTHCDEILFSNDDDVVLREIVMRANTHGTVSVILAEISTRVFFVAQMAHVRHLGVEKHIIFLILRFLQPSILDNRRHHVIMVAW